MKLKEVIGLLNQVLPSDLIEEGDNCGLLIGDLEDEITHIRTALEASEEVIDQAILDGVDLLVVHHPMIYMPLKNITSSTLRGKKALKLIRSGIGLFAAHSNLDRITGGLNQRFGHALGFETFKTIDEEGYILLGEMSEKKSMDAYVKEVGERLGVSNLRYVGDPEKEVQKVAFCTGSGMGLLTDELFCEADVYLTGDLKYHDAMDVHEKGQAVIDITHFYSEAMAAQVLYDLISNVIDIIKVTVDRSIINPIRHGGMRDE